MDIDTFKVDVEPGGLYTKIEIKILICYIFKCVKLPISADNIANIIRADGLANYFDVTQSIAELKDANSLNLNSDNEYVITDKGNEIADKLERTLPFSVREKAVKSAVKLTALVRNLKENKIDIEENEHGVVVTLHVMDSNFELMVISVSVADRMQAEMIRDNFVKNPTYTYKTVLQTLICDENLDI